MNLEENIFKELSGEETSRRIEKATREIPTRLAGSEELKRMATYPRGQMGSLGNPGGGPRI